MEALVFKDTFNRANGPLGSNWITGGSSAISVVSNQAKHNQPDGVTTNVFVISAIENQLAQNKYVELKQISNPVDSVIRIFSGGVTLVWGDFPLTIQSSLGVFDTGVSAPVGQIIRLEFLDDVYRVTTRADAPEAVPTLVYSTFRDSSLEFGQTGFGMTSNSSVNFGIIDDFAVGILYSVPETRPLESDGALSIGVGIGL